MPEDLGHAGEAGVANAVSAGCRVTSRSTGALRRRHGCRSFRVCRPDRAPVLRIILTPSRQLPSTAFRVLLSQLAHSLQWSTSYADQRRASYAGLYNCWRTETMRRDVEVLLHFLATADGGRTQPATTGYRAQLSCDGKDWDAVQEYPDAGSVSPGDSVRAYLHLLHPSIHDGHLTRDKAIAIREGARVVARGVVTNVLELPESALRERLREALDRYRNELHRAADTELDRTSRDRFWLHMLDADRTHELVQTDAPLDSIRAEVQRLRVALEKYPLLGERGRATQEYFHGFAKLTETSAHD